MADTQAYDVGSSFPSDIWKQSDQVEASDSSSQTFPVTQWLERDGLSYYEAPILSSLTIDVGGGGVTVSGARRNPLCPRANP